MLKEKERKSKSPSEQYFEGYISAKEYLRELENSNEADRKRREIVERVQKLSEQVRDTCRF